MFHTSDREGNNPQTPIELTFTPPKFLHQEKAELKYNSVCECQFLQAGEVGLQCLEIYYS